MFGTSGHIKYISLLNSENPIFKGVEYNDTQIKYHPLSSNPPGPPYIWDRRLTATTDVIWGLFALSYLGMYTHDGVYIFKGLKTNQWLKYVYLSSNAFCFDEEQTLIIYDVLKENKTLRVLDISYCMVGFLSILRGLEFNETL